jgi:hypothetical protein
MFFTLDHDPPTSAPVYLGSQTVTSTPGLFIELESC